MHPPNWSRLRANEDWQLLWASPESPVRQRIERLEQQLHDTANDDYVRMVGIKHQLAAMHWLRTIVDVKADELPKAEVLPARPNRARDLVNAVLPGRLG